MRIPLGEAQPKKLTQMNSAARIEAFLEMMSAERGAADNTLPSYRRDLEDAAERDRRSASPKPPPPTSAPISPTSPARGFAADLAGAQTVGAAAVLQVPLCRRPARRRPDRHAGQPEKGRPLPKTMSEAETGRLLDRAARRPKRRPRWRHAAGRAAPARAGRGALRHRPARFRAGRPAGDRGAARRPLLHRARQGRQGAHGAAVGQGARRRCAPGWPSATRDPSARRQPVPVSGSVRQRLSAPPGLCPRPQGPGRPRRHRRRQRSRRTCCAMPLPAICCRTAPICGPCSNCSAMPTSRRRRSTRMCWRNGWCGWSTTIIRLPTRPRYRYVRATFPSPEPRFSGFRRCPFAFRRIGPLTNVQLPRFRKAGRRSRRQDPRAEEACRERRGGRCRRRDRAAGKALARRAARHLQGADAVAEGAGGAPSRPAALPRLRRAACSPISRRSPATATSARTTRSSAASRRFRGEPVAVIGQEKGSDTKSRLKHNFGSARPEGYRKAVRLMELADRFGCRSSRWSTPPAPIPASAPRNAARPKPSPARPRPAWRSKCRRSRSSSAKAARAAPLPSPPPTASTCWSTRSIR